MKGFKINFTKTKGETIKGLENNQLILKIIRKKKKITAVLKSARVSFGVACLESINLYRLFLLGC